MHRFVAACLSVILGCCATTHAAIINVPADHATIQGAITASVNGDEIIVAPGTYNETINLMGKAITLRSIDPNDPAVVAATIIDALGAGTVVTCNSGEGLDTVISGLAITGGSAINGGGMYNESCSPTVMNCDFTGNSAEPFGKGGGMHNQNNSSPIVVDCTFTTNSARFGGGMFNDNNSNPNMTNCTFTGNAASSNGGGITNANTSSPAVSDCTFSGNSAGDNGGGIANANTSSPAVSDCTFSGNLAGDHGGGMLNLDNSSPAVTDCAFTGNVASISGGGMSNFVNSTPTVANCIFTENQATFGGGMKNDSNSSPTVTNCTFTGNSAGNGGGGMFNSSNCSPTVSNCTFTGNTADINGGGMFNSNFSNPIVTNCILSGSMPNEVFNNGASSVPVVTYTNIQGGYPGLGNINVDPMFVDADGADNIVGTIDDDLRLMPGSPCIDAGDSTAVPINVTTDLDGNERFVNAVNYADTGVPDGTGRIVDMGAYEADALIPAPCPGDANGDGVVNLDDLQVLLFNFGVAVAPFTNGDANGDGVVNLDDLQLLLFNFGTSC